MTASWFASWMGPCSARNRRMARACSAPMPGSSRSSAGLARLTLTRFDMGASFTKRTPRSTNHTPSVLHETSDRQLADVADVPDVYADLLIPGAGGIAVRLREFPQPPAQRAKLSIR